MKLTVVVVSFNVKGYLSLCVSSALEAMKRLGEGQSELYIVDNASSDGSVDWVRNAHPEVQLIALDENVGFSAANNVAIRQAKGEWVLLLNPDTVVPEDTFERIIGHVEGRPEIGGLGVPMYDGTGSWLPESKRGMPTPWASFCRLSGLWRLAPKSPGLNSYYYGHVGREETADVEVLSGAFMWMRKEALDQVGLLDESFFMYGEDIDLSIRLIKGGWVNRYYSEAPVVHFKGESTKKGSLSYVRVFHDAMRIFSEKHFAGGQALAMRWMIRLGIRLRAVSAFVHGVVQRHSLMVADVVLAMAAGFSVVAIHGMTTGMEHPLMPTLSLALIGAVSSWGAGKWFGSSDKPFHRLRIITAGLAAAIAVVSIYSLMPEKLRVSRLSASFLGVFVGVAPLSLRTLMVAVRPSRYRWRTSRPRVTVAAPLEVQERLVQWVRSSYGSSLEVDVVLPAEARWAEGGARRRSDLVLCSSTLGGASCLASIRAAHAHAEDLRIVPEDLLLALGGLRRDGAPTSNLSWGADGLGRADRMRAKRRLDLMWAFFVVVAGSGKGKFAASFTRKNAWRVAKGELTWIGFHGGWEGADRLPDLPQGVLFAGTGIRAAGAEEARRLDLRHASDFGWMRDLELLMNLRMD